MPGTERITRKQIAAIWASARDLGLDRELLYSLVPGGSISRLNRRQGAQLIDILRDLGAKPPGGSDSPPPPGWTVTEGQKALIRHLFQRLGWHENPRREEGFLLKYAGVSDVDDLTDRKRAIAIIEALKAMLARRARKRIAGIDGDETVKESTLFPVDKTGERQKLHNQGKQ